MAQQCLPVLLLLEDLFFVNLLFDHLFRQEARNGKRLRCGNLTTHARGYTCKALTDLVPRLIWLVAGSQEAVWYDALGRVVPSVPLVLLVVPLWVSQLLGDQW